MKKIWIIFFSVVFGFLLVSYLILSFKFGKMKKDYQVQSVELMSERDSAKAYKTKAGEAYFQLSAVEVEKNSLKKSIEAMGFEIKDLRKMDINNRNIIAVLNARIVSQGSGSTPGKDSIRIVDRDTFKIRKYKDWYNGSLTLSNLWADKDSLHHEYNYQTGILMIPEKVGKGIKVTVKLTDTHATITTGSSIFVSQKLKWYEKPSFWFITGGVGIGTGVYLLTK